jgi:hypothetical protein
MWPRLVGRGRRRHRRPTFPGTAGVEQPRAFSTGGSGKSTDASIDAEPVGILSSASEAWAAVHIDVAEKLDAEAQLAAGIQPSSKQDDSAAADTQLQA